MDGTHPHLAVACWLPLPVTGPGARRAGQREGWCLWQDPLGPDNFVLGQAGAGNNWAKGQ